MSFFLSGVSNRGQKENFEYLVKFHKLRPNPPFLIASTLLVPGYVDMVEVEGIARFIASLDASIPWTLLGFHPDFYLNDLPLTSRSYAFYCLEMAKNLGIKNVHLGNLHLLS
jgi:pyruvate formate lyase activating enzyme